MNGLRFLNALLCALCASVLNPSSSTAADPKQKLTYDEHVLPIFKAKCVACHNQDKKKNNFDLSTFPKLMQGGSSGAAIKPGDPDGSLLFKLVTHKTEPFMPPDSPVMAAESIETLRAWIAQGALENNGSKAVAVKPKMDVSLTSIQRGKPSVVPMPTAPLRKDPVVTTQKANAVIALAASPWAPLVAVGSPKQILLYHGDTMELVGVLPFAPGTPHVLKFSRNGSLLLAGGGRDGQSGKVVVYNVANGEAIIEVGNENDAVLAADISADQQMIALGGPNRMIRIYSTKDGSLIREVKKHTDWIYTMEFSPDAVLLATADRSGGLFVWESATGREFYNLRGHTGPICDVSWRDDSNVLASCSEDGTVKLWEMENGNQIKNWAAHGGGAQAVKFSHDNRLVSTGRDRVTKVWDQNGAAQKSFAAHPDLALRTAFSHDGQKIYSGDWTGQMLVFANADGKLLAQATTNPQNPAQALEAANKNLAARQTTFDQATAAFNAANAKAQQTAAETAPAQKLATDSANNAKQAEAAAAPAKAAADKAAADLAAATAKQQTAAVKSPALTEAYNKIKAAADANKANADLQAAAAQFKTMADQAAAELTAAQTALTAAMTANTNAAAAYQAVAKNVVESQAAAKLAAEILAPRALAAKTAADALPPLKVNLDKATAELTAAKAEVEKLKPVAAPAKK
jgi:Planctomycete cytochrome C/WD domain, G-beta repeat